VILNLLADQHDEPPVWFGVLFFLLIIVFVIYKMSTTRAKDRLNKDEVAQREKSREDEANILRPPIRKLVHEFGGTDLIFLQKEPQGELKKLIYYRKLRLNLQNEVGVETKRSDLWAELHPPIVYIVRNDISYKIGLSKSFTRFSQWLDHRWNWVACFSTAHLADPVAAAFRLESALLSHYRSIGACPNLKAAAQMRDGGSETLIPSQEVHAQEVVSRAAREFANVEAQNPTKSLAEGSKKSRTAGSITHQSNGTYRAVWEVGTGADGKRRRSSKSGFPSRAEAQRHINQIVGRSARSVNPSFGYVEFSPSKNVGNYMVRIYVGESRNGKRQTKTLTRRGTQKAAEDALAAYIEEQGL
jgi:hypothetical protein